MTELRSQTVRQKKIVRDSEFEGSRFEFRKQEIALLLFKIVL